MGEERRLGSAYVLERVLGSGASGQVWAGRDEDGRRWAFKLLRDELASDPGVVNRFVQERSVLASIRHPHVVQVHDLVAERSTLAIVMDLVDGEDLRSVMRREGTLQPARVAQVGEQVAAGLQAAHHRGVVHRDVKPENVLVEAGSGDARLTDFGIARLVDGSDRSTMLLGTPQYMAPEVADGRSISSPVDVYSLGIMLYELCCGVPPFAGRGSAMATLRAHAVDVPGRPEGVPDELWAVIEAMTAKDPAQRPTAGDAANRLAELADALRGCTAAPRLSEPPPPASSMPLSGPLPEDAPTIIGAAAAAAAGWSSQPTAATPDPRFPSQGYPSPAYGHPSQGFSSQGYPSGGYPSGGYPSQGFSTGGYPAPPQQPAKRSGALVGAVIGALVVLAAGLGWMNLSRSDDEKSAAPPATSSSTSPTPTATSAPTTAAPQTVTTEAAPPQVTVTVAPSAASRAAPDVATRRARADSTVRTYLSRADSRSITRSEMADYFTPTINWYQNGPTSRDTLWGWLQKDSGQARTEFADPVFLNFVTGLNYAGQPADRIEYSVGYVRYDSQGDNVDEGTVTVCYVMVPNAQGDLRITRVYER